MPLWGNQDNASGNQKPLFANTSNAYSNSSINGTVANTAKYYGQVYGVSAAETQNVSSDHVSAGWVSQKIGRGGISSINIVNGGTGYNANGYLKFTDNTSALGILAGGANANVSFTVNVTNVIVAVTINNPGDGYALTPTATANLTNTTAASFEVILGGRAGRRQYETLVAMGSITGDDGAKDNVFFVGV